MLRVVLSIAALCLIGVTADATVNKVASRQCLSQNYNNTIYDYTVPDIHEKENISLSKYKGKVVLIVNVATYCSFTEHYNGLNELQTKFQKDLVILGFPCNQFLLQEPGTGAEEILNGVKHIRPGKGFEPNFPMFTKIDVNGEKEIPLYTYLKLHCPATRDGYTNKANLFYEPIRNWDLRWNWEKFLIDRTGRPYKRYDASTEPKAITNDIEELVKKI
uniref:Glutathione peroxidase n=1 Tax=Clastoptera arizonana TaxID=38151 RepID=A0A1B6C1V4_9HEMI